SNGILLPGTSVAARQPKQKEKNEEWILAVVLNFHPDKNKYQVEDVEQDEYGQKQKYTLQPRNVIPIPTAGDPDFLPEIHVGQDVLALYPGTTCFYRATVAQTPNKDMNQPKSYKVKFEDDNNEIKTVMQEYILQIPKGKS
ncbi:SGF29 tudor-like domain-containing protein, partial [Cunninghamella echinulata]